MQIVDSLEKVWLVQKELRKFSSDEQKLIDTMLKWPTLNEEQRVKTYSENYCNEFNVFLYFKDHTYFEHVVKPFLTNKIEKTFIDFWLLGINEKIL